MTGPLQLTFVTSAVDISTLPGSPAEVAVVGRSNVGKSSLINALANHKQLARVSNTPGRTQLINLFALPNGSTLVDLPGYGYAEVSGSAKLHWQELLGDYVQRRKQLAALVLIMDSRRPFTDLDTQMLEWFATTGKPIHCILSKADKLNRNDASNALRQTRTVLSSYVDEEGKPFPFTAQLFSALKRTCIDDANDKVLELLGLAENNAQDETITEEK